MDVIIRDQRGAFFGIPMRTLSYPPPQTMDTRTDNAWTDGQRYKQSVKFFPQENELKIFVKLFVVLSTRHASFHTKEMRKFIQI